MQSQNSRSSPSIESLFGAKGFSGLCKGCFTGGRSASTLNTQATHRYAAVCTGTHARLTKGDSQTLHSQPKRFFRTCFLSFPCFCHKWNAAIPRWFPADRVDAASSS